MSVMLAPDVDRFGAAAPPTLNTRFRASVPNHATRTTLAIPAGSRPRYSAPGSISSRVGKIIPQTKEKRHPSQLNLA